MRLLCGVGQDSHRFLVASSSKQCKIGGLIFEEVPGMDADSDGDVVLHAICNAITSMTHVPILGGLAPKLCHEQGITDSKIYLEKALETLKEITIHHVALTVEGKKPRLQSHIDSMRENLAHLMNLSIEQIGITVTSGDGLTAFAKGEGLQCFCYLIAAKTS